MLVYTIEMVYTVVNSCFDLGLDIQCILLTSAMFETKKLFWKPTLTKHGSASLKRVCPCMQV